MSATGREQAVVAPNTPASSSTIFQFSAPFKPRPALTTISASGRGTVPPLVFDFTSLTVIREFAEERSGLKSVTVALLSPDVTGKLLGKREIIFTSLLI